jgi:hypothetical protein
MSKLVAAREVGRNTDASLQARGRVKYILHADSHKMRYWVTHPSRAASEQLGEAYKYLFIASDRTDANGLECTVGRSKGGSPWGTLRGTQSVAQIATHMHHLQLRSRLRKGANDKSDSDEAVWLWGSEFDAGRLGCHINFNAAPFKP